MFIIENGVLPCTLLRRLAIKLRTHLERAAVLARLDALAARLPAAAERLAKDLSAECPSPVYGEIVKIVRSTSGERRDEGLRMLVRDGTVRFSYNGIHLYETKEFDTKAALKVGEWNRIVLAKDFRRFTYDVNGQKGEIP